MSPILGYWDIRGLAQGIRLLLKYAEVDFEDKQYSCGPAPEYNSDCWFNEKFSLCLDFPNLPYYIDGDVKITQTRAIYRHIAREHGFEGSTKEEQIRIDMLAEHTADFISGFLRICYNPDFANLAVSYRKELPAKLKQFEDFLGSRTWFAGKKLTWVDFHIYEILDHHLIFEPNCLKSCPGLKAHHKRFEALPAIKAYMKSSEFMKSPLNNKMAQFK